MLQPGILFDNRYELIRMLGRGGFAEVWLVKDTLTDLEEALKIYAPGGGMDEDGLKIFVKELTVVHDLHHPNLLTPKMLGQYEHQPYLVLQYCPNGSLNKSVGECTEAQAWKILEQVASGLAYLHKRAIVHQDIKPDNILVDANLDYVITDFGISLKAQSTLRKSVRIQAESGTMAYMAPERFSAEPHPIPANDIWSLGAMLFELVEGNVPFIAQMGGLAQMNGAQLPTMHSNVSKNLKLVIAAMLALKPEDRPTAAEIVELAKTKSAPKNQPSTKETKNSKTKTTATQPQPSDTLTEERKTQRINTSQSQSEPKPEAEPERKTIYAQQQEAKLNANKQQTVQSPLSSKEPTTKDDSKIGWVLFITFVAVVGLVIGIIAATGGFDSDYYGSPAPDTVVEVVADEVPEAEVVEVAPTDPAWPWSPFAKPTSNSSYSFLEIDWDGWNIVLKDFNIYNMHKKPCHVLIWFKGPNGYLKTSNPEYMGKDGYACYGLKVTPENGRYWPTLTFPAVDTSIFESHSGRVYVVLAIYNATNGKCIGKWETGCYFE